jgi:PAS domain S-box-containing protein
MDRLRGALGMSRSPKDVPEAEREAIAASVLDNVLDGIITIDERGIIESVNPAVWRLFGYEPGELVGRNVSVLMPPPFRDEHDGYLRRYLETGEKRIIGIGREVLGLRKDGSIFPLDLSVSEVRVGGRRLFTGLIHDITDRKQGEADLRKACDAAETAHREAEASSRMKDEFLSTLSHELRTPLNAVLGWARLLSAGDLDRETTKEAIEAIERNALAQAKLIEDLLDVSRITSGKLRIDVRLIDLGDVIAAAIGSVKPAADAKEIEIRSVMESVVGEVSGDPTRLQQVIWNLLSNAIKFTPKGGRVEVRLRRAEGNAEIAVTDTGKGIRPAFMPHIFSRFRQADPSSTRSHGGLGLGLAIVKNLVELHGGTVEAESPGEGLGATFTVRLPAGGTKPRLPAAVGAAGGGNCSREGVPLSGLRILVVDDEPDARRLIQTVLTRFRAQVIVAGSVPEALQALVAFHPDVIVSDIAMPGEDGYALIRKVRMMDASDIRGTPAIALTAYSRTEDRMRSLSAGFQMHVPKPVEPNELATVVASLARRRMLH